MAVHCSNHLGNIKYLENVQGACKTFGLSLSGAYTDARYVSYEGAQPAVEMTYLGAVQDLSDRRLPNVPKCAYSVALDAARPLGNDREIYIRGDFLHRSSTNSPPTLSVYGVISSYGVANLRMGLCSADDKYDLSFFARNLTDEEYYYIRSASPLGSITCTPGEPRTIGGALRVRL